MARKSRKERLAARRKKQEAEAKRLKEQQIPGEEALGNSWVKGTDTIESKTLGTVTVSALGMDDYVYLQNQALRHYRKEYYATEVDFLTVDLDSGIIEKADYDKAVDELKNKVRELTVDDMPKRDIKGTGQGGKEINEKGRTYDSWWMSSTIEGMAAVLYCSTRQKTPDITLNDILQAGIEDQDFLIDAANVIVGLSQSKIAKK